MTFLTKRVARSYTPQDQALAEELARRCALTIDNSRLYAQAQAALRLRNDVLASVTHDLKNPLTGISLMAQTLEMQLKRGQEPSHERLIDGLRGINERARDMAGQLDELIDVAALEAGQPLDLQRKPTDLVDLARQVAADTQATTDKHRIQVTADAPEFIGDWDAHRIARVLRNLLNNAVKYSPEGGPVNVALSSEDDGQQRWLALTIDDQGVGIPADDLPTIFERFHRGGNVAGRIIGTGVGLATARQIVEQHGGTIAVGSREGAGTKVTVRLPLPDTMPNPEPPSTPVVAAGT
jgi:signal transduction histidine kinase